jgi:hypothetical protein
MLLVKLSNLGVRAAQAEVQLHLRSRTRPDRVSVAPINRVIDIVSATVREASQISQTFEGMWT